jgi:hypothetical protein
MWPYSKLVLLFSKFRLTANANSAVSSYYDWWYCNPVLQWVLILKSDTVWVVCDKISSICHLGIFSAIHSNVIQNYLWDFLFYFYFVHWLVFSAKLESSKIFLDSDTIVSVFWHERLWKFLCLCIICTKDIGFIIVILGLHFVLTRGGTTSTC